MEASSCFGFGLCELYGGCAETTASGPQGSEAADGLGPWVSARLPQGLLRPIWGAPPHPPPTPRPRRPARRYISTAASSRLCAEVGQEVYIDGGFEPFTRRGRPGGIYRPRLRAVYAPRSARRYISTEASSCLWAEVGQEVYIDGRFERFRRRGWPGGIYRRKLRAVYAPMSARRYISTEASSRLRAESGQDVYINGGLEPFTRRGRPGGIYRWRLRAV